MSQTIFFGIILIILFVLHQFARKTPKFLQNEKIKMEEEVNEIKKEITNWNYDSLKNLTNDMEYSYKKSMSNILTGVIKSKDDLPMVAFKRIDRGIFINSRIIAITTDFKIYFEYKNNEKLFFFDNIYLGKITKNSDVFDSTNKKIGNFNQNYSKGQISYILEFKSIKVAEISKNSYRNFFINETYYEPNENGSNWKTSKTINEVGPRRSLIKSINTFDKEELKWIISIVIFESIYYGFDFTK